jgi:hypothetical protein
LDICRICVGSSLQGESLTIITTMPSKSRARKRMDQSKAILIGEGDDWPTDYYHGFDNPITTIETILLKSESWNLPIFWPEMLSGWKNVSKLLNCLESIDDSSSAYNLFYAVDGCSINHSSWGGDSPGRSGTWVSVLARRSSKVHSRLL